MSDEEPAESKEPKEPRTCCAMRRKVLVGVVGVLPEDQCGVSDSEMADFMRFDLESPSGKPVLAFRFCPWCGKPRDPDAEMRIVELGFGPGPDGDDDEPEEGEGWKGGGAT